MFLKPFNPLISLQFFVSSKEKHPSTFLLQSYLGDNTSLHFSLLILKKGILSYGSRVALSRMIIPKT